MRFSVEVSPALEQALRDNADRCHSIMQAGLSHIGSELADAARELAGGTGAYARSMRSAPDGDSVVAGSVSPMASLIERGRKPGQRPPVTRKAGQRRSGGRDGVTAAAARRIGEQGTRGQWTIKKAGKRIANDGTIDRIVSETLRAMGSLGGGG
jgi:hypothetical protein